MNRIQNAQILLIGGVLLFMTLVLLAVPGEYTGRATTSTTANIINSTPLNCTMTAGVGRNTIGFPCIATAVGLTNIVNGSGIHSMYQYAPGTADIWKVHNPNLPSYVKQDLTFLSRRGGYVLYVNQSRTFKATGLLANGTDIPIIAGWNLVGYPSNTTRNVSDSLLAINSSYTEVRTYNNTAGSFLSYITPSGGTLTETIPGRGYWINGTQSTTWTVLP